MSALIFNMDFKCLEARRPSRPCLFNQRKLISERKKRGVFKVRPGITGLAQISGINMKTPTLLAKTDQKMIKDMSLYNYFDYIFKTIFKII